MRKGIFLTGIALACLPCWSKMPTGIECFAILPQGNPTGDASGAFSGRVWNDMNRDGLQDIGEPGVSNLTFYVAQYVTLCGGFENILAQFETDADGNYSFSFATNMPFIVTIDPQVGLGISPLNVGSNDTIDSDFSGGYYVTNTGFVATGTDLGVYYYNPGMYMDITVNQSPVTGPLHVTNGAFLTLNFAVTNTGETQLAPVVITSSDSYDLIGLLDCPMMLRPGQVMNASEQIHVIGNMTNFYWADAFSVHILNCDILGAYNPVFSTREIVVIVDDWANELTMTSIDDAGRIGFDEVAGVASYQVMWSTNLMATNWNIMTPPGIPGMASAGPGRRFITSMHDHATCVYRVLAVTNNNLVPDMARDSSATNFTLSNVESESPNGW